MDSEYYKGLYKYSNNTGNNKDFQENELKIKSPDSSIFRFYGKLDFDTFDKFTLKEHSWKVAHALTNRGKDTLKNYPGYKDNKETVHYKGDKGYAIMHRNYQTDIHKLIINPSKLKDSEDSIRAIKNMFELGLGCICYDEDNLPEGLAQRIKNEKKSRIVQKLE